MSTPEQGLSYRDAGVDIDAGNEAKRGIAALLQSTATADTLSGLGSFGGLYRVPRGYQSPVLVASTDGVGTKLKVAFMTGRHDTVGEDLVNHCVNDILVQGALPLFFMDYIGMGRVEPGAVESLVEGVARGCRTNGCALLGGETAEMPDFYEPGEYDLAGTIVGVVEEGRVIDGSAIREGDVVIALASTGLHTNGYSLARRVIFDRMGLGPDDRFPGLEESVADALLRVHRSYLPALRDPIAAGTVRGMAHITGGGLVENIPRVLPDGLAARIERGSWQIPPIFQTLQREGRIDDAEMFRAFNMGVGMVVIAGQADADGLLNHLHAQGEEAWAAGTIVAGDQDVILA